ncbi:hypothetical protein ES708_34966 [subsurface metagenome]
MNNFAVLDITKLHLTNAIVIRTTTNNPCHLTCYYTDKQPGSHRTSRNQRGLTLPWGVYYCFVAWNSVEQLEAGDTLLHTFVVPSWQLAQTKWFAFRGTVSGEISPSVSPIFEHKHTGQNLILNPGFEDWTLPPGNAPDHWAYPPAPHFGYEWPDPTIKTEGDYSCRTDNPTLYGNFYLWQELDYSLLNNLRLTFQADFRGEAPSRNNLFVDAYGDFNIYRIRYLTLNYTWETISLPISLPDNLTRLYLRVQNWNQGSPTPFQTWIDNFQVSYTP